MNKNHRLILLIVSVLLFLAVILSGVNYKTTFKLVRNQIEQQSLPLSLDNIYTDIQKQIIKPYLITSMMANDTFVKEWLTRNEEPKKIKQYLKAIKNRYGLLSAILVHDKTKNYYTQNGFLEKLHPDNRDNRWYFRFKNSAKEREINIDTNIKIDNAVIMFMNNKILNDDGKLIGITSTGVKIASIHKMLEMFKNKYHMEVYLFDKDANIILTQKNGKSLKNLTDLKEFQLHKKELLSKKSTMFSYESNNEKYIFNTKYIAELDLHILVKAKLSDFTGSIQQIFYFNLAISLLATILIAFIILSIVNSSLKKLEKSNKQKEILLNEVHHRVKNNLNLTASMLGLQAIQEDEVIRLHLLKSKSRIEAIATVHEMLYKYNTFSEINFYDYILRLETIILTMFKKNQKFKLLIDVERELTLPLESMVPFGLIINEMFTNSIKYAKNSKQLKVNISLKKESQGYTFFYKDNGEEEINMQKIQNSKGLGSKLIELNIKQLNGNLTKYYNQGLSYEINFKILPNPQHN